MSKEKEYHLVDCLDHLRKGGQVSNYEWEINEHIELKNGYFVDESGADFMLAPWMLEDHQFIKMENLK